LRPAELPVCCRLIRFSWHGAGCPREILRFSTVSLPEVQKKRGADVDFQARWAHVSYEEHQVSPRGACDWWTESVRKSVSVHQDKIRGSAIHIGRILVTFFPALAFPASQNSKCTAPLDVGDIIAEAYFLCVPELNAATVADAVKSISVDDSAESSAVLVTMAKTACARPHLYDDCQRLSASLDDCEKC